MIHRCMTIYESSKGAIHFVEFSQNNYNSKKDKKKIPQ